MQKTVLKNGRNHFYDRDLNLRTNTGFIKIRKILFEIKSQRRMFFPHFITLFFNSTTKERRHPIKIFKFITKRANENLASHMYTYFLYF